MLIHEYTTHVNLCPTFFAALGLQALVNAGTEANCLFAGIDDDIKLAAFDYLNAHKDVVGVTRTNATIWGATVYTWREVAL